MLEKYISVGNKQMRYGYTTGTCAAAAAKAAVEKLYCGENCIQTAIQTPKGFLVTLDVTYVPSDEGKITCYVCKDSGDDPDVTNGIEIYATASFNKNRKEITIDGGIGVGRITRKGLACEIGKAAINPMPMNMIRDAVQDVRNQHNDDTGIDIMISVPQGVEVAKRTFNPRLGIVGGISILGTTGIVEPMSEKALIDSIKVEIDMLSANGYNYLLVSPGNYGTQFTKMKMDIDVENSVKCSNFIGETIDHAAAKNFRGVLMVGHIGKFVKVAGGIMNTHSRYADCRMEIIAAYAALAGATQTTIASLMGCVTTDDAINILIRSNLKEIVLNHLIERISFHMNQRTYLDMPIEIIVFSHAHGILGKTDGAQRMLYSIREENQ